MSDESRGHGAEHFAQREVVRAGDIHSGFLVITGTRQRQWLKLRQLGLDALDNESIFATDDFVDKLAVGR